MELQADEIGDDDGKGLYVREEIPADVICMIMERLLHVTDIVRLSCVCKAFGCALKQNPSCIKQEWPCLMVANDVDNCKREFISFVKKKRYIIDHEDFAGAQLLDTKKGWLLFSTSNSSNSLFLLHPVIRKKLLLPIVVDMPISRRQAAISVEDSDNCAPTHVVLATYTSSSITVAIASPGDVLWRKYTCTSISDFDYCHCDFNNLIVARKYAYCVDKCLRVFVFDMENLQWEEFKWQVDVSCTREDVYENIIQIDGQLIRVACYSYCIEGAGKTHMEFDVYKLDRDKMEWIYFKNSKDVEGMSLFVDVKEVLSLGKTMPTTKIHLLSGVLGNISYLSAHEIDSPENQPDQPFGMIRHAKNWAVADINPDCSWVDMDFDSFSDS